MSTFSYDLPDCTKIKLADMDLVRRTLHCQSIEKMSVEEKASFTPQEEEAEENSISSEDHTSEKERLEKVIANLDCMYQRVQQIQLGIKARKEKLLLERPYSSFENLPMEREHDSDGSHHEELTPPTTPPVAITPLHPHPVPLSFADRVVVRDLKHKQERMQCQIDEMICRFGTLRCMIRKMRKMLSSMQQQLRDLLNQVNGYSEWSKETLTGRSRCLERFRVMQNTKIPKVEANRLNRQNISKVFLLTKAHLQDTQFMFEMNEFRGKIDSLMQHVHDLRIEMQHRFDIMEHETLLRNQLITLQVENNRRSQDNDSDDKFNYRKHS